MVNIERSIARFEMNLMSELNGQPLKSNILEYGSSFYPSKAAPVINCHKMVLEWPRSIILMKICEAVAPD